MSTVLEDSATDRTDKETENDTDGGEEAEAMLEATQAQDFCLESIAPYFLELYFLLTRTISYLAY